MLTNDSEFGAPWNDQFYDVTFYFRLELNDIKFTSEQLEISFCLSGPRDYDHSELREFAYNAICEEYKFDYDQIIIIDITQR